ncbi:hypothetical protein L198_03096 [Cryptococcus wingfieldii CBS 7118]|uniref:Major facilitator superfamily (MFS) profile domain-containing protein n=1 Tax=Cryptococcus wingfieldii CBS 7118 TaxID=1295528 RepID=A0A1E3JIP4_9TREE|nr:hypothetical protein L198_03096 [Cryptococcus wingfieldii CBS 7118]ODO00769.1 hypothetical protein L198_03096 [Cryptococcus wingfieldii CBS 7118]
MSPSIPQPFRGESKDPFATPSELSRSEKQIPENDSQDAGMDTIEKSTQDKGKGKQDKVRGKGLTEGDNDMPDLPENNLKLVMPSLALVMFLAALDQTIVATALPTIAEQLNASPSEYSWVGTSYMLASTLQTPINGRVSDIVGRKPLLYAAILIFTVFSALCGAAKTSTWLIVARAFQGLGGGCIIGLTSIIASDIVPLEKRGAYQGFLGASWGVASVLGPILGGVLTSKASWRWCFYINLPTCGVALLFLVFTLKLNPTRKLTLAEFRASFDFLGLLLLMMSSALLIVGFSRAADFGFDAPSSYAIIIAGGVILILAVLNFLFTQRNAIIPARMFKNRTTLFFLIGSLLHASAFLPSNYLLPQMFQGLRGDSPIQSGVHILPYSIVVAWMTVVTGQINSRLRIIRPTAWVGYAFAALGYGLFYKFYTSTASYATQEGLLVLAAVGIGSSLQSPMLILQAAMPLKEMAAATSAWSLTRMMGGSIGLAVFTAILNTEMRSKFKKIDGYGTEFTVPESASGYSALQELPDGSMKEQVMAAFADSFRLCWIIGCAFFLVALALTLWTRSYSTRRGQVTQVVPIAGDETALPADVDVEAQGDKVTSSPGLATRSLTKLEK